MEEQLIIEKNYSKEQQKQPSSQMSKSMSTSSSSSQVNIKNKLTNKEISVPTRLFINNEFTSASDNSEMDVINPSNEESICKVSCANENDADRAIDAAFKAYFGSWSKLTGDERSKLIFKLADLFEKNISDFAYLESLDNGKVLRDSIEDMEEMLKYIRYFGGWADKIEGKSYPCANNISVSSRRIPYGVVGVISPWSYPLLMSAWKIFPALAAGNTIVLKPSEETPLTSLKLAELFVEAGFPEGVVNIVPGCGNTVGARITSHSKVRKVSFSGAMSTGREVMKHAAESNLKNVHLELGGKSALIVCDDADMDKALNFAIDGAFRNTSQNCSCSSRILLQDKIHKEFLEKFIQKTKELKIGDAFDNQSYMGPLISKRQFDWVNSFIKHGLEQEKLNLATGGKKLFEKGFYLEPTVFTDVPDDSKLAREEIFGPVICFLKPFKTIQEAIDRANNSDYGLAAGVFSKDPDKIELFSRHIQAGTVWVNMYNYSPFNVPFGGCKQSGFGRDNGYEAIVENTVLKSVFQAFNFEQMKGSLLCVSGKASSEVTS